MGVVENLITNEEWDASDAAAPVATNFLNVALPAGVSLNDTFHSGGGLFMGVVENTKRNDTQADVDDDAPYEAATKIRQRQQIHKMQQQQQLHQMRQMQQL